MAESERHLAPVEIETKELDLTATQEPGMPAPQPESLPYDSTPLRETTRTWVIGGIGVLLLLTILGLYLLTWQGKIEGEAFMQVVFPSLIELAGTALGFYFGGREKP